tara:strand:+ start:1930 stop:3036 length:1107 start_codon:yes stop_codon:yes gene_type:complete
MNEYEKAIEEAELALNNGKYENCIDIIKPILDSFSISSKEGINLRMSLITAYSGINKNNEALKICKQLTKSRSPQVRDNAKYLIQILNAPNLKTPDNWNIKFENNIQDRNKDNDSKLKSKKFLKKENFIKITDEPTGETKPFKKGFIVLTISLLISLLVLLSGCVKIKNNLDFRNLNSINIDLSIESKYIEKIPWQINFEKKISESFNNSIISIDKEKFIIEEKGLDLDETKNKLNQILKLASETTPINFEDIKIDHSELSYFFAKKHLLSIMVDLANLDDIDNLDISINLINPSKPFVIDQNKNTKIIKNDINWQLRQGVKNQIKFTYWDWNKLFLSIVLSIFIVLAAYLIQINRYQLGSNLPKLPS